MRLIDADKLNVELSNKLNEAKYQHEGEDYFTGISEAISMLGEAPTVEERKHGHWTADNRCSVCGNPAPIDNRPIHKEITLLKGIACPYCGAEMDEVEE